MAVEEHDTASVGLAIEKARWLAAIAVGVMLFAFACATEPEPDDASQLMAATVTPSAELSDTPLASQPTETPAPAVGTVLIWVGTFSPIWLVIAVVIYVLVRFRAHPVVSPVIRVFSSSGAPRPVEAEAEPGSDQQMPQENESAESGSQNRTD